MSCKTTNQLMSHLRISGLQISGSRQKRALELVGYYHGYKGYRFFKEKSNRLDLGDFDELQAIIDFDINLKAMFYAPLMQLETALKSYVGQLILESANSSDIDEIFKRLIFPQCESYDKGMEERLKLRDKLNQSLTKNYQHNRIVQHFMHKDQKAPLWAVLEVIDLGTFGHLVKHLKPDIKENIAGKMGFRLGDASGGKIASDTIFVLKGLRNAVAHNNPIFDTRFHNPLETPKSLPRGIARKTNIPDITFSTIADFLILVIFLMLSMGYTKTYVKKPMGEFKNICNTLGEKLPAPVYHKIVHTDYISKINGLEQFLKEYCP